MIVTQKKTLNIPFLFRIYGIFRVSLFQTYVAFRAKCKIFSRHLQKPILKTEKGRFKGL